MSVLKIIELPQFDPETVIYKYDLKDNVIKKGTVLVVREGQTAVFCDKGRIADIFEAGSYKLDTDSLPVITKLLSWKYGFETPFKSEVYFVSTGQFTNIKWGTANPVPVNTDMGTVRLRGHGSYSFKIADPAKFLREMSGTAENHTVRGIANALRALIVGSISTAFGTCKVSINDMTEKYAELSEKVLQTARPRALELGIELTSFDIENLSVPPEVEKALDENLRLGILRGNIDIYTQIAEADAIRNGAQVRKPAYCTNCGAPIPNGAKFCPDCGNKITDIKTV